MELVIGNKNYSSWSLRPWLLMRQLGLPFHETLITFGDQAAFQRHTPLAKVPVLKDGAQVVWESIAIFEYVAEHYAQVWPKDRAARAWARSAAAEMHAGFSALRQHCPMHCAYRLRLFAQPATLKQDIARLQDLWREGLQRFGGPFLAGAEFSGVDAFFAPMHFRLQTYGLHLADDAQAYSTRMLALPSMQQWYQEALQEPWRDEPHDAEVMAQGELQQVLWQTQP